MKKKFDLNKFKKIKESERFLRPIEEAPRVNDNKKEVVVKKERPKKSEKIGRPMLGKEPLNKKITLNFTVSEEEKIRDKAGDIPITTYLRNILKDNKVI